MQGLSNHMNLGFTDVPTQFCARKIYANVRKVRDTQDLSRSGRLKAVAFSIFKKCSRELLQIKRCQS